jgi:hypothetical protein
MNLVTLMSWITRNALQLSKPGDKLIKDMFHEWDWDHCSSVTEEQCYFV